MEVCKTTILSLVSAVLNHWHSIFPLKGIRTPCLLTDFQKLSSTLRFPIMQHTCAKQTRNVKNAVLKQSPVRIDGVYVYLDIKMCMHESEFSGFKSCDISWFYLGHFQARELEALQQIGNGRQQLRFLIHQ